MKRYVVSVVAVSILALAASSAASAATMSIRTNPLGLMVLAANVEVERAVSASSTLGVDATYLSYDLGIAKASGFSVSPIYRKYLRGEALDGFYLGASADAGFVSGEGGGTTTSSILFGLGGVGGFRWVAGNGFTTDLNAGLRLGLGSKVSVGPALGFSFGYTW